jgi:hypothetical protein
MAGGPTSLAILVFLVTYLVPLWARRTHAFLRWLYAFMPIGHASAHKPRA